MIEKAGFTYDPPPVISSSMPSLELAELARDAGRFTDVHFRLFDAYWSRHVDIGNADVLREIARDAGLDTGKLDEAWADGRYQERIALTTHAAIDLGMNGVPAWLIDDALLVSGALPHEVFEQAMIQLGYEPAKA